MPAEKNNYELLSMKSDGMIYTLFNIFEMS